MHGHFFGDCSLSLVLFSEDARALERSTAEALKVLASHDGAFIDETYNLLNAWLAIVPGNSAQNLRRLPVLETNYADLSFLFTLDTGEPRSAHLHAEALAVLETEHQTAYHFNLHVDDVGHTLVLGATGSGKSFLLNFLIMHAQKYEPLTVIFDLGQSYQKLATLLDGHYLALALRHQDTRINPFALDPTPENLHLIPVRRTPGRSAASPATSRWRSPVASVPAPRWPTRCMPVSAMSSVSAGPPSRRPTPPG